MMPVLPCCIQETEPRSLSDADAAQLLFATEMPKSAQLQLVRELAAQLASELSGHLDEIVRKAISSCLKDDESPWERRTRRRAPSPVTEELLPGPEAPQTLLDIKTGSDVKQLGNAVAAAILEKEFFHQYGSQHHYHGGAGTESWLQRPSPQEAAEVVGSSDRTSQTTNSPSETASRMPSLGNLSCTSSCGSGRLSPGNRVEKLERLRHFRDRELTGEASLQLSYRDRDDSGNLDVSAGVLPVMRLCGILPWDLGAHSGTAWRRPSVWYQWAAFALVATASAVLAMEFVTDFQTNPKGGLLADLPLALCGVLGFLTLGTPLGSAQLCSCNNLIFAHMQKFGFLGQWKKRQRLEAALMCCLWAGTVGLRVWSHKLTWSTGAFALVSAAVFGLSYCFSYLCNALIGLLDLFGHVMVREQHILRGVHDWNVLQAVMRMASGALEWCVFSLQVTAVAFVFLATVDVVQGKPLQHVAPGAGLFLVITWAFFRAAQVSDKCARLPSIINSLDFGKALDTDRQYVVEYMKNSAAGFYVFEVQITSPLALKLVYVSCAVVFAFARPAL